MTTIAASLEVTNRTSQPLKYSKRALLVFLLLAFIYAYFYHDPAANGNTRFDLIFAIVQQGQLSIDSYYYLPETRTGDVAFFNSHYYSDKAIGTSLFGLVFYAPMYLFMKLTGLQISLLRIKYILTILVIGIPSAFAGSLVYVLCETISGSRLRAYLATLAVCLGTMVMPFSAIYFGHQLAGAFIFSGFFLIFQLKLKPDLRHKWGYLFLTGLLLGSAFLTEYTTLVIIVPLGIYYLFIVREKVSLSWLRSYILPVALGALIPIILMMVYNTLCFGNPFTIGYENLGNQFRASMSQGFMGISWPRPEVLFYLTFHPAEGLFWQSPVLLMAVIGLFFVLRDRRYRFEGIIVTFAFIAFLLINAGYFMWWGGYSFAPRHLIPMLMFLSIPLVKLPRPLIPLAIILALISIGQMFIPLAGSTLVPDSYFVENTSLKFFGYSTIYSYSLRQLLKGFFAYNLGEKLFGLKNWMILLPTILAIIVVSGVFIVSEIVSSAKYMKSEHRLIS